MELVKYMVEKGATEFNEGMVSACLDGHIDVVKNMIEMGANGFTRAARNVYDEGHDDIVQLMKKKWE